MVVFEEGWSFIRGENNANLSHSGLKCEVVFDQGVSQEGDYCTIRVSYRGQLLWLCCVMVPTSWDGLGFTAVLC